MTEDLYATLARANPAEAKRLRDEARLRGDHRTADRFERGLRAAGWQPGKPVPGAPGVTERVVSLDRYGFRKAVITEVEPGFDTHFWCRPFMRNGLNGRISYDLARQGAADEHARREGRPPVREQRVMVPVGSKVQIIPE